MPVTIRCTRKGCGAYFDMATNDSSSCNFHTGTPRFHEGLKSWTCCNEGGKRTVSSFEDFMAIPPCTTGTHSSEVVLDPGQAPLPVSVSSAVSDSGLESYGSAVAPSPSPSTSKLPSSASSSSTFRPAPALTSVGLSDIATPTSTAYVEEQDDPAVELTVGLGCKRKACGIKYEVGMARADDECLYHPGVAGFREGSKGYSCCKRRVLEFDEFLAIKGCQKGKHLFVGAKKDLLLEESVECRTDHYQTPRAVMVSIFGKGADKEKSSVRFEEQKMHVDLFLPNQKRFTKTFDLYGPIDPTASTFTLLGTKCEVVLAKADARSWPSVSSLDPSLASNFVAQLVFSAGGQRGTTGAKEMVLDSTNARS